MTDEERVVKRLTAAQCKALLWCEPTGEPREWPKGAETSFYCLANVVVGDPEKELACHYKLVKRGEGTTKRGYWPCSTWRLTPLGTRVRTLLQDQQP